MARLFVMTLCLWSSLMLRQAWAEGPPEKTAPPPKFHIAKAGEPIAGIPQDEALKIFDRHVHELYELPGTISVNFGAEGLIVRTTNPEVLPAAVEGLPVFPFPPVDPPTERSVDETLSATQVVQEPPARLCAPGYTRDPVTGECVGKSSVPPLPEPQLLPPPPGFIVLKPGKVREQADACPEGFKEVEGYGGWRFCVDPLNPEKIPPLWSPPIAGIPYEQVLEIHRRHVEELGKLPGVESAGLGADGIHVWTSNPDIVPKEVEGVPVIIHPATGMPGKTLNHTYNTFVRPLHGAVSITETTQAGSYGTLTGVTLSDGKPWIIFPAHLLGTCDDPPPCNSTLLLNRCDHYDTGTQPLLLQPVTGGLSGRIGYAQRWTPISSSFYSPDIAAAFMDSDVQENNGFLAANRKVHDDGSDGIAFLGTPVPELPPVGLTVLMRSSIGPPHALQLQVQQVNTVANNVITGCRGGAYSFFNSQIRYSVLGGYTLSPGDSGSPVFDLAGRLVGMLNACLLLYTPETGYYCDPNYIYGTDIITTKNNLKFDAWYGTQTVYDQTIGIFRPSTQQWILDNGNNKLDACGTDLRYYDTCLGPFGQPGDTPVTGRWNSTVRKIGVFRSGSWYLDFSGNGLWGTGDVQYGPLLPYQASDLPVVGSWGNPNNGYSKIGIFRNGTWYVDYNGNGVWDGCTTDRCWTFMAYQAGDKPVVIGRVDSYGEKIGVFRNGT